MSGQKRNTPANGLLIYIVLLVVFNIASCHLIEGTTSHSSSSTYDPSGYSRSAPPTQKAPVVTPRPTARPTRKPTARPTARASSNDPYHAGDYAHPDDFYYDHTDDFWDFEDAEDYWERHH